MAEFKTRNYKNVDWVWFKLLKFLYRHVVRRKGKKGKENDAASGLLR